MQYQTNITSSNASQPNTILQIASQYFLFVCVFEQFFELYNWYVWHFVQWQIAIVWKFLGGRIHSYFYVNVFICNDFWHFSTIRYIRSVYMYLIYWKIWKIFQIIHIAFVISLINFIINLLHQSLILNLKLDFFEFDSFKKFRCFFVWPTKNPKKKR